MLVEIVAGFLGSLFQPQDLLQSPGVGCGRNREDRAGLRDYGFRGRCGADVDILQQLSAKSDL